MSGLRVLKWTVDVDDQPHEIGSGSVLHVACQQNAHSVQVWTLEDARSAETRRLAQVFATGQPLPGSTTAHIGSALAADGLLVWHVFAVVGA